MSDEPQDPQVTEPEEPVLPPGVTPRPIEEEMKASYIDYSMSVIVGRALPDVRDGLKPVQRRILYAMHELGMLHNKPYKKCARIVGEVLGKYHPHGDLSVYDALVRMVQDFSLRYPLVQGQGNFGSVDGDNAAAMRYTECRLSRIADELLEDLDKDTVEFGPNFDESLTEPLVLPGKLPNLLVNGAAGIAVGMATNIPPHNLAEVVDGIVALIDNPEIPIKDLMKLIKGPDFPTGAMICGKQGIRDAYELGRGSIVVRAKIEEEDISGGRTALIVTEIPFQVNKSQLLEQIATLVREKKIEGISDLRDESDRRGMRVVIEIKRDAVPEIVQNQLFHHTPLETKFSANMLAIVGRRPKVLNLKQFLEAYLEHRKDVITRRTRFDLAKAEARAHIVAGLRIALEHLNQIIKLIRESKDTDAARAALMSEFGLSKLQAQAILDMRLHQLTGLERDKLEQEYKSLLAEIARLKGILADARKVLAVIREEALELKRAFGDARRTKLTAAAEEREIEDLIQEEEVVVSFSHAGYVKRLPSSTYRTQFRGGKGVTGMTTRDEDFVEDIFVTTTHAYLLLFTNRGRVYWLKVYEIPEAGRAAKGKAIVNLLRLTSPDEKVTAALSIRDFEKEKGHFLLMLTRHGVIKKTPVEEYAHPRSTGIIALKLSDGDALIDVKMTDGKAAVMLATKKGMAAYFAEDEIRDIGRVGRGVRGIRLADGDAVVGMELVGPKDTILTATEGGYGKRSKVEEYRFTHRGAKGVTDIRTTERNGSVVGIKKVTNDDELMLMTGKGMAIRIPAKSISIIGRATQGVRLVRLEEGDKLTAIARIAREEIVAGAEGNGKGEKD